MKRNSDTSRKGQAISEYLILVALISVGSIAVIQLIGHNLQVNLGKVSEQLRGHKSDIQGKKLEFEHYKVRDLGDFGSATQDNDDKN